MIRLLSTIGLVALTLAAGCSRQSQETPVSPSSVPVGYRQAIPAESGPRPPSPVRP